MARSIEIQDIKSETGQPDIIRQSFRVPVEKEDDVWAVINENKYHVKDISNGGISIEVENISDLDVGQTFEKCQLIIFDKTVENLTAKIVHLSNTGDQGWKKGIQWIYMDESAVSMIADAVSKMKKKLLERDPFS